MDHSQAGDVENFWAVVEKKLLLAGMTKAQSRNDSGFRRKGSHHGSNGINSDGRACRRRPNCWDGPSWTRPPPSETMA